MTAPTPVLIVGDAPSAPSGLGRILGDIAARADASLGDVCRIATLGYGGPGSRKFKFFQYSIEGMTGDFVIPNLPDVWEDWAGEEPGIIFCIWDASRLGWFSRPNHPGWGLPERLKLFLINAKIQRWIYCPVDAEGPHGKLSFPVVQSLLGFDRILAYGQWGEGVLRKSLGDKFSQEKDLGSIPHGIDSKVFYSRDRLVSRQNFYQLIDPINFFGMGANSPIHGNHEILIGTVATNQARKDWGLWAKVCALYLSRNPSARFWVHTDQLERYWSIPALLMDYGLADKTAISLGYIEDDRMAQAYSACDLTLGIGAGEGFGLPIAESAFCETPVVHGQYAGATDYLDEDLLVKPVAFRLEGVYACERPVFAVADWVEKMEHLRPKRVNRPAKLDWQVVWPSFDAWFRQGLNPAKEKK